jgi:hypothetical protein
MYDLASSKPSFEKVQRFTQLHTDYMYSYSQHPTCIVTAITKNLCKNQAHINKEVRRPYCAPFKSGLLARWTCSRSSAVVIGAFRISLTCVRAVQLARSQELSLKDIPQGSGPSTASMVQPW